MEKKNKGDILAQIHNCINNTPNPPHPTPKEIKNISLENFLLFQLYVQISFYLLKLIFQINMIVWLNSFS